MEDLFRTASTRAQLKTDLSPNFSRYEMFSQFQRKEENILKMRTELGHILLQILTGVNLITLSFESRSLFVNIPKAIGGESSDSCRFLHSFMLCRISKKDS